MRIFHFLRLSLKHVALGGLLFFSLQLHAQSYCPHVLKFQSKNGLQVSSLSTQEMIRKYQEQNLEARKKGHYASDERTEPALAAVADHLSELLKIAKRIVLATQKRPTLILGLGGSPSVMTAIIQTLYPEMPTRNLPLSIPILNPTLTGQPGRRQLNSQQIEDVMKTWERFLPPVEQMQNYEILVVDFAATAESLLYGADLVDYFYQRRGAELKVRSYALHEAGRFEEEDLTPELTKILEDGRLITATLPYSTAKLFVASDLKPLAEYPSYIPQVTPVANLQRRSAYNALLRLLKTKISPASTP